ncbi:MAG: hypothetical protein KF706_01975 [Chitinophagales bacterium]|nr:hypothetical protein [Chitinophagales bacterium]
MKYVLRYLVFCAVTFISISVTAQKHDYIWFGGYDSQNGITDTFNTYGITKLDFNKTPVEINYDSLGMNFDHAPCSIADKDGNLLFLLQ